MFPIQMIHLALKAGAAPINSTSVRSTDSEYQTASSERKRWMDEMSRGSWRIKDTGQIIQMDKYLCTYKAFCESMKNALQIRE